MNRLTLKPSHAALAAVALVLAGAAMTFIVERLTGGRDPQAATSSGRPPDAAAAPSATAPLASSQTRPDVRVSIPDELVKRANITLANAVPGSGPATIRVPAVVEPNAYRQIAVNSLVSGRVTAVSATLGASVRRGDTLARIYSADLSEAEQRLVAARAMLEAHDKELRRAEKLATIGAASRQELERIHAEHAAQTAEVESARSRVQLLGGFHDGDTVTEPRTVQPTVVVAAPIDGVVTERIANVGENVATAAKLFTVVDLSSVWIIGDVFERDLAGIREGSTVTVTSPSIPAFTAAGRVSYHDPQVNPATRTGRIRVELPNPGQQLRLGMYVDVAIQAGSTSADSVSIPHAAVQTVGDSRVVYLAVPNRPGSFVERAVRLGARSGERVEVLSGLQAGEAVVVNGSFSLRAEVERAGLRTAETPRAADPTRPATPMPSSSQAKPSAEPQQATVVASEKGFEPPTLKLRAGVPARITFRRTTDKTCATEVIFPSLKIKRDLPLNQPVVIELTPQKGELTFACGMNMFKGSIVVQ